MMRRCMAVGLAVSVLLTGCWNRRDPNEVDYVVAVGIDMADDGQIALTIQSPSLESLKPQEGGNKEKVKTISVKGKTSFEAIRNYIRAAGRKLFWGHTQIYVIGEEAAKAGVERYLDFFSMDPELRGTSQMAVVKGKAKDVVESKTQFTSVPANYLGELVRNSTLHGHTPVITFAEFNRMQTEPEGGQPYLPMMRLIEQSEYDRQVAGLQTRSSKEPGQTPIVYADGTAVFRGTKLVGTLNERETRGLMWVGKKMKSAIVTVPCGKDCLTSLEMVGGVKAKKKVEIEGERAILTVEIKADLNVADRSGNLQKTDEAMLLQLEEGFNKVVRTEVEAAFAKASVQLRSDVMAFGNALSDRNPKLWKEVKPEWEEYFLPDAKLTVKVEGKIRRTSRTLYSPWAKSNE